MVFGNGLLHESDHRGYLDGGGEGREVVGYGGGVGVWILADLGYEDAIVSCREGILDGSKDLFIELFTGS